MLSFTPRQLNLLGETFTRALVQYLRDVQPRAAQMPQDALHRFVTAARGRAEVHGFHTEQHQCDVVEAAFVQGTGFWHDPRFQDITARQFWTAEEKSRRIRLIFVEGSNAPEASAGISG